MAPDLLYESGMWNPRSLQPASLVSLTPDAAPFGPSETPEASRAPGSSLGAEPSWQLYARLVNLVVKSQSSQDRLHRVVAGLGLLAQVQRCCIQDQPSETPHHLVQSFCSDSHNCWVVVQLDPHVDPANVQMIQTLLATFAELYQQARHSEAIQSQAHTDALTTLWNRRGFEPLLDQAVARWHRTGEPLALMAIDVDYFKQINDSFGHDGGDLALQHIAQMLTQTCRPTDVIARLGGDELVVLLGNCDAQGAELFAQRVQEELLVCTAGSLPPLSLSIGIADSRAIDPMAAASPAQQLLKGADQALYEVKRKGRGTCEILPDCAA